MIILLSPFEKGEASREEEKKFFRKNANVTFNIACRSLRREELKAIFMLKETENGDFKSNPRKSITQARSNELKGAMKAKSCDRRNEVISIKIQFRVDNN